MKTKAEIVANWLPRYTGTPLKEFGKHILLVNFNNYVRMFAKWHSVPVRGEDRPMPNATAGGITIINFGMGSASAATIMDLLARHSAQGGVVPRQMRRVEARRPISAIWCCPSPPSAARARRTIIFRRKCPRCRRSVCRRRSPRRSAITNAITGRARFIPRTAACGSTTTQFKKYLRKIRCIGIDMETATIFITGFHNEIPTGALLLVSDQPMVPEGVKTAASDQKVTQQFLDKHLHIGIDSLKQLINRGLTVKHLRF